MNVTITEFILPNGRQAQRLAKIDDKCKEKYKEIESCGYRLTMETLRTGELSQCIEGFESDIDCVVTEDTSFGVINKALEDMILRFDKTSEAVREDINMRKGITL